MIGYRKWAMQIFAIVASLVLTYFNKDAISDQFIQGGTNIIGAIFDLIVLWGIPQGGAAIYNRANIKAKEIMAKANGATQPALVSTTNALLAGLGIPLDLEYFRTLAQSLMDTGRFKFAPSDDLAYYLSFREVGFITPTTSITHAQQWYDELIDLAQRGWLSGTAKVLNNPKSAFSWDQKDAEDNLAKGYSPGCHALGSYSWARHFGLDLTYRFIAGDIRSAQYLDILENTFPDFDIVKHLGVNATLGNVGALAEMELEVLSKPPKPRK